MTNLEWLKTLSAEELTEYLRKECLSCTYYGCDCDAEFCYKGHIEWLNAEHTLKVKPCPVCKGEMSTIWKHCGYYLVCKECGLRFGLSTDIAKRGLIAGHYAKKEALIDDWNTRLEEGESRQWMKN